MWYFFQGQSILIVAVIVIVAVGTAIRVVLETRSPSKTAAYLLLIILLPIMGSAIYFLVGVNYRKRRIYTKKLTRNATLFKEVRNAVLESSEHVKREYPDLVHNYEELIELHLRESLAPLSHNRVQLLINGEQKFPALLQDLERARSFIHIEYYIIEDGLVGNQLKEVLIRKAKEGVSVRIIFDDFGSRDLHHGMIEELRAAGVKIFPFYRIYLPIFANRINYRDHRKVVIIDGSIGYVGGMNIADRYVNHGKSEDLYWRDTHIRIEGFAALSLQYHFLSNWNFCANEKLGFDRSLFPVPEISSPCDDLVQIITSGPDYPRPSIMLSYFAAIMVATSRVYITTPYFIPNESIFNAIKAAAFSGKDVQLLIPFNSDSAFVDAASHFYVQELLESGVRVFFYKRGLIHAKTMVVDDTLSFVGTANMDLRSFELNFEINAVVYSKRINTELTAAFAKDLTHAEEMTLERWNNRSTLRKFLDGAARILAPLL